MNENNEGNAGNVNSNNGRKAYAVYTIIDIEGDKAMWRRVGNGYVNRDGSYNLVLDALPVNGRLHMREPDNGQPSKSGN